MSNYIASFKYVPVLLFRLNAGASIKLREYSVRRSQSFDVFSEAGMVLPKALDPVTYQAPNGASMRPLGDLQTKLVKDFKGSNVVVYAIPEGTILPDDLILVHEHTDHYSLQPAVEMQLKDLGKKITRFLETNATVYSKKQWLEAFKTGQEYDSSAGPSTSSSQPALNQPEWIWSEQYKRYYSFDENGEYIWQIETKDTEASSSSKKHKKR